jgi:predicted ester cyclase
MGDAMAEIAVTPMVGILQKYLDAFNRADWETYKTTLTPDSVHIEPGGMELHGPDASVEGVKIFKVAFPDLKGEVIRLMTGDQEAAAEIVWKGTHTGRSSHPLGRSRRQASPSRSTRPRSSPSRAASSSTAATTGT